METDFYISYFEIISATNWLRTCACSLGGPGRNRDEQRGGRSTLGTDLKNVSVYILVTGGDKGTQQSVIWGGSALRSNPVPVIYSF